MLNLDLGQEFVKAGLEVRESDLDGTLKTRWKGFGNRIAAYDHI